MKQEKKNPVNGRRLGKKATRGELQDEEVRKDLSKRRNNTVEGISLAVGRKRKKAVKQKEESVKQEKVRKRQG